MKKLFFIIFLMVFSFAITANAKKPKVVWPKAVLTLKDGTVLNGYLRSDIHFMQEYVLFSETEDGKDVKYKNENISFLVVKVDDAKDVTFVPIKLYWNEGKKILKTPVLAIPNFQGKHVKGYMYPAYYDHTATSISYSGIMSMTSYNTEEWWAIYNVDTDSTRNRHYWIYAPTLKNQKTLKKCLKDMDTDFKEYPQVREAVEKQGLTKEQIDEDPTILLEILDKSLQ